MLCEPARHHHHAICRSCGRVEDVDCGAMEQFAEALRSLHGFRARRPRDRVLGKMSRLPIVAVAVALALAACAAQTPPAAPSLSKAQGETRPRKDRRRNDDFDPQLVRARRRRRVRHREEHRADRRLAGDVPTGAARRCDRRRRAGARRKRRRPRDMARPAAARCGCAESARRRCARKACR